jgi:DNA primase
MKKENWVDFKAIKQQVNVRMVLDHYHIDWLRKKADELRGRCPIHRGEGQDTFHVNLSKNAFQCFSCKARGNVLDFVAAMEQCSVREAAVKLAEWFAVSETSAGTQPARAPKPKTVAPAGEGPAENKPLTFQLKGLDPAYPYLQSRGISKETAEKFGLGFFPGKGSMHGRIVIPIHDEHGSLLAYAGRAVDAEEPKYKLPAGFHKSLVLYNLHRAVERSGEKVSTVVLVEGFFGCIWVHEAGYPCVALMGSSLSEEQEALLCRQFTGVVILLDGGAAGQKGIDECLLRLGRKLWTKAITLPPDKQPDQLSCEELAGLLG